MKILKRVQGHDIILDYRRVKRYSHRFTVYNVYKMLGKAKRVFLYRTSLSDFQLKELVKQKYVISEESLEDDILCLL